MDVITFSAVTAVIASLFAASALGVYVLVRRRDIRRLQAQVARLDGLATPVDPERSLRLRGRARPGQGGLPVPGRGRRWAVAGATVAILVALGGAAAWWYLGRGGGSADAASEPVRTTALPPDRQAQVPPVPPSIGNKAAYTVAVLNASGVPGAARARVAPRVQQAGYNLGPVENANRDDVARSVVMWTAGRRDVALNVARDLGIGTALPLDGVSPETIGDADVVVVVGRSLARRP